MNLRFGYTRCIKKWFLRSRDEEALVLLSFTDIVEAALVPSDYYPSKNVALNLLFVARL